MATARGPLISTAELAEMLASSAPVAVLDVRWAMGGPAGREQYLRGHIPGAVFLDLDADLAGEPGSRGRHPLPDPGELQSRLRAAGVCSRAMVVAYDSADGSVAARAWWLLRWAGHRAVAVLDGGFAAWEAERRQASTSTPGPPPGDIDVVAGAMPVLDAAGAAGIARDGVLLDARAPGRYAGESEPIDPRAGHIPGARNAPFAEQVTAAGRWRSAEELAARFAALGVTAGTTVGAYCGSGVTATSVLLALERAGLTDPRRPPALYAGSWSHWCADPNREVATGHDHGTAGSTSGDTAVD
ncbi:MAG: sulfurtransferase [Sciscionella sp.]